MAMGEDLLERSASLIHFQRPSDVQHARERLTALRNSITPKTPPITAATSFDAVARLLAVAENKAIPAKIRSHAIEQARSRYTDSCVDQAMATGEQGNGSNSEEAVKIEGRIDAAEKQCVSELFTSTKGKVDQWISNATALTKDIASTPSEKASPLSEQIVVLTNQGFGYLQEIMPFSQSGIEGAPELYRAVDKQLKLLERQKNWLYNQQVLRLVREIESNKDWTAENKIKQLAEVREELLSPYVLRRHNELWEKVFESLPDEDKKVWAVSLRVLRVSD